MNVSRETSPPPFDFKGLTPAQQRLLTFQGWQPGQRQQGKQPVERQVRNGSGDTRKRWMCGHNAHTGKRIGGVLVR